MQRGARRLHEISLGDIEVDANGQEPKRRHLLKSTNTGALVAEAGLRPATPLLDNRQRRFALRLAGLPSSDQARCVVGAKDLDSASVSSSIWRPLGMKWNCKKARAVWQTQVNSDAHIRGFLFIRDTFRQPIRTLPLSVGRQDVGVTLVENGHSGATEELSASSTKLNLSRGTNKSASRVPSKAEVSCFFSGMKIRLSNRRDAGATIGSFLSEKWVVTNESR